MGHRFRVPTAVFALLAATGLEAGGPIQGMLNTASVQFGNVVATVKSEIRKGIEKGRIFWVHPKGDAIVDLCTHLGPAHPGGDGGGPGPCLHLKVSQHPGGHVEHLPCFDPTHASIQNGPCKGHDRNVGCLHLVSPHSSDPLPTVPCIHVGPLHPGGHPTGKFRDCIHELAPVDRDDGLGLVFYDCDSGFRAKIRGIAMRLKTLGVKFAAPRILNVFNRPFIGNYSDIGGAEASQDPFWSHYCSLSTGARHYLQVTRGHPDEVLAHELGHAILGDQCVWIDTPGGSHTIVDAGDKGLAMSEGWAHFVEAVILLDRGASKPVFKSWSSRFDFEKGDQIERKDGAGKAIADQRIGPMQTIELCVGTGLWDLFDTHNDGQDSVSFSFAELFKVYRPGFETLLSGPKIPDFADYLDRLDKMNPGKKSVLQAIRSQNAP